MDSVKKSFRELKWYEYLMGAVMIFIAARAMFLALSVGSADGNPAWLDAFVLSIGIIATILELLRCKEQYVWWIITDIISVIMYIVHFDAVYLTKRSIYLIVAIIGFINWTKLNRIRNVENE